MTCPCPTPPDSPDDRRRLLLSLLPALFAGATGEASAQDAVKVLPSVYRVALENDRVRVLEFPSKPGLGVCGVGMHSHPAHLTVSLTDGQVRIKTPDGQVQYAATKAGDVFWSEAETHETENLSGHDMRALLIELKPQHA